MHMVWWLAADYGTQEVLEGLQAADPDAQVSF